jgi:alanyl-tRNA synthetase
VNARDLLNKHLAPFNGRGGGDPSLAQGGGTVDGAELDVLFKQTKDNLNVT